MVTNGVRTGAANMVTQFNLGIAFDVNRPLPARWIEDRLKFWAVRVNETTAQQVVGAIRKANELGESIPQIADRIEHIRDVSRARAEATAITEMVGATGEGHLQAFEQAEIEKKQWWTALDERVRDSHAAAHGQIRRLSEDFDVGGQKLRAPGQGGSAEEVIGCRCLPLPVFER